jgi:8-oxo-dGTP pyrophosphatase MutT (NUDIX family)
MLRPEMGMSESPRDNDAHRFPVSVKGIVVRDGAVVLMRNRRGEWELPGGKLEPDESPERCVVREIEEELALDVEPEVLVDSWVYTVAPGTPVLVLTYGCRERTTREAMLSDEHTRFEWFALHDVAALHMPNGYKSSIARWTRR